MTSTLFIYVKLWDLIWSPRTGRHADKFSSLLTYHSGSELVSGFLQRKNGHLLGIAKFDNFHGHDPMIGVHCVVTSFSETYGLSRFHPRDIDAVITEDSGSSYVWFEDYEEGIYHYLTGDDATSSVLDFFG